MSNLPHEVELKDFKKYFPNTFQENLSEDLLVAEVKEGETFPMLKYPCRIKAYLAVLCLKGEVEIEINLKKYKVKEKSLVIYVPGNIIRITEDTPPEDLHMVVVAMSSEFISSSKLDFVQLYDQSIALLHNPCIFLNDKEFEVCIKYLSLAGDMVKMKPEGVNDVLSRLLSSAFYFFCSLWQDQIKAASKEGIPFDKLGASRVSSRSKMVCESFLQLVRDHHTSERNMSFYADKLCLSPKYLSKVVKDVSGQSGPQWIDSFVVLEAKNMLKHSNMPIKEIVYRLNFQNSSVFYKFFKAHTGMTPSEYRG